MGNCPIRTVSLLALPYHKKNGLWDVSLSLLSLASSHWGGTVNTSLFVSVYLGSGICLACLYSLDFLSWYRSSIWLTSLLTCVRMVRMSSPLERAGDTRIPDNEDINTQERQHTPSIKYTSRRQQCISFWLVRGLAHYELIDFMVILF